MGKNNAELLKIAEKYLGKNGRQVCGMTSNWCNALVCKIFREGGDASLYYGGKMVTYCPTSIKWCQANLANIPIYLALPMDVIYFDWNANNVPDHIGFVRERKNDQEVRTIEGNTSKVVITKDGKEKVVATGVVAYRTRPAGKVLGCFRPAFKATWKDAPLVIDGYFGYNSIAMLQKALKKSGCYKDKIDGILGKNTVKALQKKAGVAQDGSWGKKTTKAVQKMVGTKVDGAWGKNSTKALQKWINTQNGVKPVTKPKTSTPKKQTETKPKATKTKGDEIADLAKSYVGKVKYVKGGRSLKNGCDCTGFVQAIFKKAGITLKVSDTWGKSVGTSVSNAKAGDIIYYYIGGSLHHMGIYIGGNKIVHNSTSHKDWHNDCCISGVKLSGMKIGDIRRCWK